MAQLLQRLLCGIIAIALFPVSRAYAEKLYYWFDNDLSNVMQITLTDGKGSLDCSTLVSGIHTLGFYIEENGKVSVPSSRLFYKAVNVDKDGEIIYDIFIDGNHHSALTRPYANETKLSLDLLNIEKGDHVIEVWATLPGGLTTNLAQAGFYHEGMEQSGTVALSFTDAEGNDVTNDVTVNWRDSSGSEIATGNKLSGLEEGDTVYYSFILPEPLGVKYREERGIPVIVKLGTGNIEHALKAFENVDCVGNIHCGTRLLEGATVTVTQYPNDRFTVKLNTTSGADGSFSLPLIDAPTRFDVTSEGYIDNYLVTEDLTAEGALPIDIDMEKVGNKSLSLSIDYRRSTANGPESQSSVFMDYSNVGYSVACDGEEIVTGILSTGIIPLPDGIEAGSTVEIRIASATNAFDEVSASAIIDEADMTSVDVTIEEMGGIKMSNEGTSNYTACLYNDAGSLITVKSYRNGEVSFTPLADGNYRVVSIASASGIGAITSIDDFAILGLRTGTDYIVSDATVAKGYITELSTGIIPEIGEDAISTLTGAAEFHADKTLLIADEFLTGTIKLNLSDDILEAASGATVTVSLPEGGIYEQGSLIVDGKIATATFNGNKLSFRLSDTQLNSRIRFSLRSEKSGDFKANAIVSLDMPGNPVCRVGEIAYHISDYDVAVPKISAKTAINLRGTAAAFGSVEIFDGENLIGVADADGNGRWSAVAELNNPVNLSSHSIWIRATRNDGFAFRSQPKTCQYNKDHIAPTTVTMINTAHTASSMAAREFKSVFSLDGEQKQPKSYYYWPQYPDFTFLIDFNRNDPSVISAVELVVFTESNKSIILSTEYNDERGSWVASHAFDPDDLPVNVDVDYVAETPFQPDFSIMEQELENFGIEQKKLNEIIGLLKTASNLIENTTCPDASLDSIICRIERKLNMKEIESDESEQDEVMLAIANATSVGELIEISNHIDEEHKAYLHNSLLYEDLYDPKTGPKSFQGILEQISLDYKASGNISNSIGNYKVENIDQVDEGIIEVVNSITGEKVLLDITSLTSAITSDFAVGSSTLSRAEGESNFADNVNRLFSNPLYFLTDKAAGIMDIKTAELSTIAKENLKTARYQDRIERRCLKMWFDSPQGDEALKWYQNKNLAWHSKMSAYIEYAQADNALKQIEKIAKPLGRMFTVVSIGQSVADIFSNRQAWIKLINDIDDLCDGSDEIRLMERAISEFKDDVAKNARLNIGKIVSTSAFTAIGAMSSPTVIGAAACFGVSFAIEAQLDWRLDNQRNKAQSIRAHLRSEISKSQDCDYPDDNHNGHNDSEDRKPPYPRDPINPIMDPSGFVYEGVLTRPVEGVTSTLYFNPTTEGEGTVWNAEDYSQINPQLTDGLGKYGWDVPRGNWRVVFEKEGYETTMTDWLPVPPPQLDVNIGMRKISPATLKEAHAYEDEVTVEMDTYMDGSTLTDDGAIYLTVDGNRIDNAMIELIDGEGTDPVLASRLRIVSAKPFEADKVTLHIGRSASTYCGVPLESDIDVVLPVEPKLRSLDAPARFDVAYGGTASIKVKALPGAVAEGRTLNVAASSSLLLDVDTPTATFDADGYATVNIAGLLPGSAVLTFSVEGYDLTATTAVTIGQSSSSEVAAPEASIPSGSVVYEGTEVTLTCDTPDAVIYYTTDGSCPCDPASTRRLYDGPIALYTDMTLKAIAVVDGIESDIAVFVYTIEELNSIGEVDADSEVKVYPIPAVDLLNIKAAALGEFDAALTSTAGVVVMAQHFSDGHGTLDVSSLPSGFYILTLRSGSSTRNIRVVKR